MIKLQDLTPSVYYNQSRDFQFIGRLFEVMLNSVKTNASLINHVRTPDSTDNKLLELYALTLGLNPKHKYDSEQLAAICSSFAEIMRNKGSIKAVKLAGNALVHASHIRPVKGATLETLCEIDKNDSTKLHIYVPQGLTDLTLLNDLLDYILPAGMTCDITTTLTYLGEADTKLGLSMSHNKIQYKEQPNMAGGTLSDKALTSDDNEARNELFMNNSIWRPENRE